MAAWHLVGYKMRLLLKTNVSGLALHQWRLNRRIDELLTAVLGVFTYSRSSLNGHSLKRTALLTAALTNPFLLGSQTNFVFTHSGKRPNPATDTIPASRGCPLTGASTVLTSALISQMKCMEAHLNIGRFYTTDV